MQTQRDRRDFLREATALFLTGSTAFVDAGEADPKVRVAVVGTGGRGSDLIRALTTIERANLVAICDDYAPHRERGQKYAGPQAKAFADYAQMLRETKPDAVVIATPLSMHYAMCVEAMDADCAVFCEKTMCYSIDQAKRLAELVKKKGTVFQVGLQRRANAIYRQAVAMVQTGMLGSISAIECQWHRHNNWRRPLPVPKGHPRWSELEHRLNWRLYRETSQGLMAELASHQLDIANWILGATPTRVMGSGGLDYWRDGREVFDNVFCTYDYEQKRPDEERPYTVRVTYSSIQNNAYEGASELIMGTKGTLFLTLKKGLFYQEKGIDEPGWSKEGRVKEDASLLTSGKTLKMSNDPWAHRGKPYELSANGDDTRDELIAFLRCVQNNDPATICDAQVGLQNATTILLGEQAMREGKVIGF